MTADDLRNNIDPGTGLTWEEMIDAFCSPREAKSLKAYLLRKNPEGKTEDHPTMAVTWT